jgi:hypothetical protein
MAKNKNKRNYWTIQRTKRLFENILCWMLLSEDNVFVGKHIIETEGISIQMVHYLLDKFNNEETVVETWGIIKGLEKERLCAGALIGKYKESFAKFLLNCNHNMVPKSEQQVEVKSTNIRFDFGI